MKMKLLSAMLLSLNLSACAQTPVNLSTLQLNEKPEAVTDVSKLEKKFMFDKPDMISYGVNDKNISFNGYTPRHVELLVYKGLVAGYAFKIMEYDEQVKIEAFLKKQYPALKLVDSSKWVTECQFKNNKMVIDFSTVKPDQFQQKANGYINVRRLDFYNEYERLMKK